MDKPVFVLKVLHVSKGRVIPVTEFEVSMDRIDVIVQRKIEMAYKDT